MKNFSVKMKENYHRKSREPRRLKYLIWVFIALCVLFLAKGALSTMTSGVTRMFYMVNHYMLTSSATIPVFVRSRNELLNTIRTLEQDVASGQGINTTFSYITEENAELRALLSASSSPRILAGVIARPPYTPYDTFILDKGSADGIVEHAPVFYGTGVALGYVHSVFPHMAFVTLFSSPGVESTVYLFGSRLFTTAYGEGGGVVHLSVPQGIPLTKGSAVVLPSLDTGVLGVVDDIQSIATEPEQHAYVTLSVPLQSIRLVSVGTTAIEPVSFDLAQMHVTEEEKRLFMIPVPEEERIQKIASTTPPVSEQSSSTPVMSSSTRSL